MSLGVFAQEVSQQQNEFNVETVAPELGGDQEVDAEPVDWKQDEVCRMVFFAVLEGLYSDGVADDVVSSIIGPKGDLDDEASMQQRMKRSFVMDCPLCQPTFEAFLAYQNRPRFNDGSGANNFGEGLDEATRAGMLSEDTRTRLEALKSPVRKWISKKMESMDINDEQIAERSVQMRSRFDEGKAQLIELMQEDKNYESWSPYWGCAACNAAHEADMQLMQLKKK
jgi:hypothetical protein